MNSSTPTGRPADRVESQRPLTRGDNDQITSTLGRHVSSQETSPRSVGRPSLSDRDLLVLMALGKLRLLTGAQVQRLCVADGSPRTQARRTRALLQKLTERKLIVRLDRRIGGERAGSAGYVYGLSGRGQAAIEIGGVYGGRRRRVWETKPAFLDHVLAVADIYVGLVEGAKTNAFELLAFDAEPAAWRTFPGRSGEAVRLKPDAYVQLGIGDFEHSSFIEVDLATESLTTIHRKCMTYIGYLRSGIEQAAEGVFPSVAWLTTTEHRASRIASVLKRLPAEAQRVFGVSLLSKATQTLTTTALGGRMA